MSGNVLIALLSAAACIATVAGQVGECLPNFSPRPSCSSEPVPGWLYWSNMQYKYFPRRLSMHDADAFCKPWDEEVCAGEGNGVYNFLAYLGSFVAEGEDNLALLAAYRKAPINSGNLFWLGAVNIDSYNRLVYTDRSTSAKNSFAGGMPQITKGSDCVALDGDTGEMQIVSCDQRLPFVCKIQPNKH